MDRTYRCEVLGQLPDTELDRLAAGVLDPERHRPELVTPPTVGMVMARVREGVHGDVFNLGEVLVTECRVRVGESDGWAMVSGSRPAAALAVATLDAVLAGDASLATGLDDELGRLVGERAGAEAAARARLDETRVRFATQ